MIEEKNTGMENAHYVGTAGRVAGFISTSAGCLSAKEAQSVVGRVCEGFLRIPADILALRGLLKEGAA